MRKNIFQKQFDKALACYLASRKDSIELNSLKTPSKNEDFSFYITKFKLLLHSVCFDEWQHLVNGTECKDYGLHGYNSRLVNEFLVTELFGKKKLITAVKVWYKSFLKRYDYITYDVETSPFFTDEDKCKIVFFNNLLNFIFDEVF